jgi:hypothetical protein
MIEASRDGEHTDRGARGGGVFWYDGPGLVVVVVFDRL